MSTFAKKLLTDFAAAVQRAERPNDQFTDDANHAQRRELLSEVLQTYRPQANDLLESATKPLDRNRLKKAMNTSWEAIPIKWAQVEALLNAGQDFGTIIDQATDLETLGAILEHAEAHLTAQALQAQHEALADRHSFVGRSEHADVDAQVTNLYDQAARRATQLGNPGAKRYLDARADQEADKVIAGKVLAYMNGDGNSPNMLSKSNRAVGVAVDGWDRQAETAAARVKGEPTPNERDMAAQQAERSRQFAQDAAGADGVTVAPTETPAALAARIPRAH